MFREAYDEVVLLAQEVRRRDRLRQRLSDAERDLESRRAELATLESGLTKEERDVQKLEGRSLTRVLLSVVGKVEERLDKERAEALKARLLVEAKAAEVDSLQAEVDRLRGEVGALAGVDEKYKEAFKAKVGRVLQAGGEAGDRLSGLIAEVTEVANLLREIDEAWTAGNRAERYLAEAIRNVQTLEEEQAAVVAAMTAVIITVTMSSAIPTAHRLEENLKQAHGWLGRYARELADIPGWWNTGTAVSSHANLLVSFINIVGGGSTEAAERSKGAVRAALEQVRKIQAALQAARSPVAARHDDAVRRYRQAVEFA